MCIYFFAAVASPVASIVGFLCSKVVVKQCVLEKLGVRPRARFLFGYPAPKFSGDPGTSTSVKRWCPNRFGFLKNRNDVCCQSLGGGE